MPDKPVSGSAGGLSLPSWRMPANRMDWAIMGVMGARWLWARYKEKSQSNRDTTLRFSPDDAPYYWLLRWLEKMPRQESLSVFRVMPPNDSGGPGDPSPKMCESGNSVSGRRVSRIPVLVPTEGVTFLFDGVKCHIERGEVPGRSEGMRVKPDLTLRIESRAPRKAMALLEAIYEASESRKEPPRVYVFQWHWQAVRTCPTGRAAILPDGQYADLSEDLKEFFETEEWYREVGLPYRRGYLLHGLTGSGKSTSVIALAGDFGLNVCQLSLASHTDDTLLEAIRSMPGNSILLLEDIDCAWDKTREAKDGKQLTFSGILNVLDGAATPEGRVTFMTTNKRNELDGALIRPGRVDKELEFTYATRGQIAELAKRFSKDAVVPDGQWAAENISMAQVQERLIQKYRTRRVVLSAVA